MRGSLETKARKKASLSLSEPQERSSEGAFE